MMGPGEGLAGQPGDALVVGPGVIGHGGHRMRRDEEPRRHHLQPVTMALGKGRKVWCAGIAPAAERIEVVVELEVGLHVRGPFLLSAGPI